MSAMCMHICKYTDIKPICHWYDVEHCTDKSISHVFNVFILLQEKTITASSTICSAGQRTSHVFTSSGNSVEIRLVTNKREGEDSGYFMLQYQSKSAIWIIIWRSKSTTNMTHLYRALKKMLTPPLAVYWHDKEKDPVFPWVMYFIHHLWRDRRWSIDGAKMW